MAFTNVIRRSASCVIPLAIRATGSQRYYHHKSFSTLLSTAAPSTHTGALSQNLFRSSFSTATQRREKRNSRKGNKPQPHSNPRRQSDDTLVKIIDTEILCAGEFDDKEKVEDVPKSLPFKIEDEPGKQTITLTREDDGENITVKVHLPKPTTVEEDESDDDDDDDDDSETCNHSHLNMVVRVSKHAYGYAIFGCVGPCLEFGVSAYPDKIEINTLLVMEKDDEGGPDKIVYGGPDFGELDETLQKAFHKYLGIRGINPRLTNFLYEYMINKESKDYVGWLEKVKEVVKA